jgi:CubicO group peptidase (beta-lactamase class C family)
MASPAEEPLEPTSRRTFLKIGIAGGVTAGGLGIGWWIKNRGNDSNGSSPFTELVRFIDSAIEEKTVPGAAIHVTHRGIKVFDRHWGTYCGRDRRDVPFDAEVSNMLYSVSKFLTSTVVIMAKQAGLVDYDAPVSMYVPEFQGGARDEVTIRHCLTLASGMPSFPLGSLSTDDLWKAGLKRVCESEPRWKPGSKSEYHNIVGHLLAAECVRRRAGMRSWTAICKEFLFDPIGAASLTFELPPATVPLALTPQPEKLPATVPGFEDFSAGHPGAGAIGTLDDVAKVVKLHMQEGRWEGKQLIDPALIREAHTVQYAKEILAVQLKGTKAEHKSWGLGVLLRGDGPDDPGYRDYGFDGRTFPGVFGQNGISVIMTVADPSISAAVVFLTTDSPKPATRTADLWNGVTERAFKAVEQLG